jgi:arylsulfatase A-like enzyme
MIVRWPGRVPAGQRSDFVWGGWDFLPTAAALAGAKPPAGIDGIDVTPALRGESRARAGYVYWELVQNKFGQAVREGDLKAVRIEPGAPIEVYDLRADPGEAHNIAASRPEFVARARELFRTARTESAHWPVDAGSPASRKEGKKSVPQTVRSPHPSFHRPLSCNSTPQSSLSPRWP